MNTRQTFGISRQRQPHQGTANSFDEAKAHFKTAWKSFKAKQTPEKLAAAYAAMNIRRG